MADTATFDEFATVVITVEPEHLTGDWWLTVAPPGA